ncbi:MAG: SDR family oxidoreductase [Microcystis aeruginosa F13-15]|nr:SDR family oxidoreductase [Microcystis aeruginosa F13-15]
MNFQQVIITGGSSGIGKAIAKLLVQEGSNLFLIARNAIKLDEAKLELELEKKYPEQKILTYAADVSDRLQIEQAMSYAINTMGVPDLLITSAGIAKPDYFQNLSIEVFERTMAVNYFGSLYCLMSVTKSMNKKGKGQIVLLSSGAGLMGFYGYSAYSPSKFAVRGLAESLRGELKLSNIYLSVVYPPDTNTPQLEEENKTKPPETKAITATAKIWSAEDVAQKILQGIKKKAFIITPGLEMSFLARFHSLLFEPLNFYFDRIVGQVRSER